MSARLSSGGTPKHATRRAVLPRSPHKWVSTSRNLPSPFVATMPKALLVLLCAVAVGLLVVGLRFRQTSLDPLREEAASSAPSASDVTTEEPFDGDESIIEERFRRRREHVRETCRAKRNVEDVQCTATLRIIYFWDYNASICTMGKVGSGTWRNHGMVINNLQINPMYERRRRGFVKRPLEEIIEYTKSRTHWITVRHPLTRLVSCFQDKYNNGRSFPKAGPKKEFLYPALISNDLVFKKTESQQYLQFLKENNESLVILERGDPRIRTYVTFTEFLHHVVTTFEEGTVNRHWQTYGRLCSPCFFDYDYITTIETQDEDLTYLFEKFSLPSNPLKAKKVKETHDTKSTKDLNYYKDVPLELRRKIYHIYKVDMEMFGYDLPEGYWDSP